MVINDVLQLETPEVLLNLSSEDTGYVAQLSKFTISQVERIYLAH